VRPRSFGYVVFEGPTLLLDWGVQSFRNGANAVRIPLATKIAALLEDFRPAVVVAKEPPSRKKVNRAAREKFLNWSATRPACAESGRACSRWAAVGILPVSPRWRRESRARFR